MISEPFMAAKTAPIHRPLNMDLENLQTDFDYAKRAKDSVNFERIHAKTYQSKKYIPQHRPKKKVVKKHVKPF